jgi:hypothetical protein
MNEIIQRGAKVLLYRNKTRAEDPYPSMVTVTKVHSKTFEVDRLPGTKFLRSTLQSANGHSSHAVTALDSEQATRIWKIHYRERAKSDAMAAVDRWNTGHGRDDLAMLNAAINALTAFRDRLTGEQS